MHKLIVAIIRQEKIEAITSALKKVQVAFTYSKVKGFCGEVRLYQEDIHDRVKIEIITEADRADTVKTIIVENACCGLEGDGCLSVYVLDEYITFDA
jgi:nitrogen regulatory protein PII